MIEEQKQYEELQKRREELKRNREKRAELLRRRRNRKIQKRIFFIFLLLLAVLFAVYLIFFSSRYRAAQTAKLSDGRQSAAGPAQGTKRPTKQSPDENLFSDLYYYESSRLERYQNYSQLHSEFSPEDVVWRVNAGLDLTQFTDAELITEDQLNNDLLIVVNKYHRVPNDYQPPDLVQNADGCIMRAAVQKAFDRMKADAQTQGYVLRAASGYRSVSYQEELYQSYLAQDSQENVDRYSARAGYSEHHTGLAVDVFGSQDGLNEFVNTPEYTWVRQNGAQYGFMIRYTAPWEDVTGYQDEPWHLRYVGIDAATEMKEQNISTLEEYREKYVIHKNQ